MGYGLHPDAFMEDGADELSRGFPLGACAAHCGAPL